MDVDRGKPAPRGKGGRRKGSGKRAPSGATWELRAVQALADVSRWEIVRLLSIHEDSVGEVARRVGLSIATTSRHISILIESEIVVARKDGRSTRCRLAAAETRAGGLLRALGIESLDGLVSGPERAWPGDASSIPEFEPAGPKKRRYPSNDLDDFLF